MRKREKIWYIRILGEEEGPYSFIDLRSDPRVTPEVEAKKKDWPYFVPIGKIAELKDLFQDPTPLDEPSLPVKKTAFDYIGQDDELTISLDPQNPLFLLLLLLTLLLAFLSLLQFLY